LSSLRKTIVARKPQKQPGSKPSSRAAPGRLPYLLTLRSAFIFVVSCVAGSGAGVLTYLTPASPAQAVLAGLGACAACVTLLNSLIAA